MRRATLTVVLALAAACAPVAAPSPRLPAVTATPTEAARATPTLAPTPTPGPTPAPQAATCGQEIKANFVLANDLTCPKDGLIVAADNVVLDLGGRTLTGPGMGEQTWPAPNLSSVGVKAAGRKNVTVRNGSIQAYGTNILFDNVFGAVLEDIRSERSRYGAYLSSTHSTTVRRMFISANIYGLHLQRSDDNAVLDNQLVAQTYNSPGGYGFYAFAAQRNRIVGNTIEGNLNWGIWLSDARKNVFFHNNVARNNPPASDNIGDNVWYDTEKKEGNWWADYRGRDGDGDGIGDTPYVIGGPGNPVDPYPFVERDGWKKKTSQTIDHYAPAPPKERRDVRLVALAGDTVVAAAPGDASTTSLGLRANAIALARDERTLYVLDRRTLAVTDAVSGDDGGRFAVDLDGRLVANRDGRRAIVIGPEGAMSIDVVQPDRQRFTYRDYARDVAPSWKHNILFVSTERGIDIFYIGKGGNVPYTIPLDGPGGALAMNRSGTRIYAVARGGGVIDVVDTEQYMVVDRLTITREAVALAVSPDERALYVLWRGGLVALELPSGNVLHSPTFGGSALDLAVSPNGDELYVSVDGEERGILVLRSADLGRSNLVRADAPVTKVLVATY